MKAVSGGRPSLRRMTTSLESSFMPVELLDTFATSEGVDFLASTWAGRGVIIAMRLTASSKTVRLVKRRNGFMALGSVFDADLANAWSGNAIRCAERQTILYPM